MKSAKNQLNNPAPSFKETELHKSAGIYEDFSVRKEVIATEIVLGGVRRTTWPSSTGYDDTSLSGAVVIVTSQLAQVSGALVSLSGAHANTVSQLATVSGAVVSLSGSTLKLISGLNALSGAHVTTRTWLARVSGAVVSLSGAHATTVSQLAAVSGAVVSLSGAHANTVSQLATVSGAQIVTRALLNNLSGSIVTRGLNFVMDAGTSAITTGIKGDVRIPYACKILGSTLMTGAVSGAAIGLIVDLWKDTIANYPPTSADRICSGASLTLSGQIIKEDTTLTNWNTSISAGDIIRIKVNAVNGSVSGATLVMDLGQP